VPTGSVSRRESLFQSETTGIDMTTSLEVATVLEEPSYAPELARRTWEHLTPVRQGAQPSARSVCDGHVSRTS
jgi:hypothetical protein